jgi:hypothetical protein
VKPINIYNFYFSSLNYNFDNEKLNRSIKQNSTLYNQLNYKIKHDTNFLPKIEATVANASPPLNLNSIGSLHGRSGSLNNTMSGVGLNFSAMHPDVS